MKLLYYVLLFTLMGCGQSATQKPTKKDKTYKEIIYDRDAYWDSICTIETKNAEKDILLNKLTYFHAFGMMVQYRSNEEMNALLSSYNIRIDSASYYCTVPSKFQHCYAQKMDEEIAKRFGKNFIDSLRTIAEKQYVKNNPNRIYEFEECDTLSRYPNDKSYSDFFDNYEKDFFKTTPYPEGYVIRKEKEYYSSISADFILQKDGSVSNIEIEISFENKKNYQYSSYFTHKIKEFIAKTKWIPARSMGTIVNSKVPLTIHFK